MSKTVLVVYAHPEPKSLTRRFVSDTLQTLDRLGYNVLQSDLYSMGWKATFDAADFPHRTNPDQLMFIQESEHAYVTGQQTQDVIAEQQKLLAADAVIFHFPLWWFGMPAILKGWIDRVYAYGFAYGYQGKGNRYRYGDGIFKGKRAILSVMVGGPDQDYGLRGINGSLDELLFPITHGMLFFPGFDVLSTHAVYGTGKLEPAALEAELTAWNSRLEQLFDEAPIPFRRQDSEDYHANILAEHLSKGETGLMMHIDKQLTKLT
ncbi:NAD(P)H-dependent oxidoreductase [Vibrio spartinae]|uniref:Glutathione-regulated potassium-efflux system ancillary protein KefF n=1 Tax=Vibrio spartinae TaxID=1918945 RepID=A0A1N6M6Q6_9VIBR|nr:NAD(P)H-dependent oxidoreductase [Vibrio spartinae]QMV14313.1 Glutathione-regulated potassium-efflux system ancillary protein KefF [Vibrio spartinae]SIO95123.1 Glutathione-regulated potassium-efflux system ancillary protein KefF [Vibrio spartinae]